MYMTLRNLLFYHKGWEYIGTPGNLQTYIHPYILNKLNENSDKKFHQLAKHASKWCPDVAGYTVYAKGKTYVYKAKIPPSTWIENQGHGGYITSGGMRIYKKKKG